MTKIIRVLSVVVLGFSLSACDASSENITGGDQNNTQGAEPSLLAAGEGLNNDVLPPVASEVLNDDTSPPEPSECSVDFDQAELLFTESDRQWFCAVSSTELASSDEVYFSLDGTAVFTRFGQVFWNRNLQTDEINIASPFISSFVMRDINSSNTTLQFTVDTDVEVDQRYDCVLVGRADSAI